MPHFNARENNPNWRGGVTRDYKNRILINAPGNARANHNGYVFEHLLIAEKALGRPLKKTEEVHHLNLRQDDNANLNLVICQDHAYHLLLHRRMRALSACGHADWAQCRECKKYDNTSIMTIHTKKKCQNIYIHKKCNAVKAANYREDKKKGGDSHSTS